MLTTREEDAMREQAQQEFESRGGMSRRLARPHRTIDSNSQAMVPHQYPSQHQTQHQQHDQTSWQVAGNAVAPLASFASAPQATIFVGLPLVSISQQQVSALSLISRAEQCVEEFGEYFGREVDDLDALQELCRVAGFVPPNTVGECVTALSQCHMNMFDVVEVGGRHGLIVDLFCNRDEMLAYSRFFGKVWPKKARKGNRLLSALMKNFN